MRHWIAILLLLTLPWQAMASTGSWTMPCSMAGEAMVADALADGDMADGNAAGAGSDCCNDFAAWARTGQVCQAGTVCMPASVWPALAPLALALSPPPPASPPMWLGRRRPLFSPSGIWRPPSVG